MISRAELCNLKNIKSKGKNYYMAEILVVDDNNNSLIYKQFIDYEKYKTMSALLEQCLLEGNSLSLDITYDLHIVNNELRISFDI